MRRLSSLHHVRPDNTHQRLLQVVTIPNRAAIRPSCVTLIHPAIFALTTLPSEYLARKLKASTSISCEPLSISPMVLLCLSEERLRDVVPSALWKWLDSIVPYEIDSPDISPWVRHITQNAASNQKLLWIFRAIVMLEIAGRVSVKEAWRLMLMSWCDKKNRSNHERDICADDDDDLAKTVVVATSCLACCAEIGNYRLAIYVVRRVVQKKKLQQQQQQQQPQPRSRIAIH
eukprot:PhF_6_TR28176/c0_g1_i1/m.41737